MQQIVRDKRAWERIWAFKCSLLVQQGYSLMTEMGWKPWTINCCVDWVVKNVIETFDQHCNIGRCCHNMLWYLQQENPHKKWPCGCSEPEKAMRNRGRWSGVMVHPKTVVFSYWTIKFLFERVNMMFLIGGLIVVDGWGRHDFLWSPFHIFYTSWLVPVDYYHTSSKRG